jgi:hypothetical protein
MGKVLRILSFVAIACVAAASAARADGDVTVYFEYLTDNDGYNYGANWYLSSTSNQRACVYPSVVEAVNVNGSVVSGPVLLQPGEQRVSIGQYIAADQSQPWSSNVTAKWKEC